MGSNERFKRKVVDKIGELVQCMSIYRSQMEFNNTDLNASNVKLYTAIHKGTATIFRDNIPIHWPKLRGHFINFKLAGGRAESSHLKTGEQEIQNSRQFPTIRCKSMDPLLKQQ